MENEKSGCSSPNAYVSINITGHLIQEAKVKDKDRVRVKDRYGTDHLIPMGDEEGPAGVMKVEEEVEVEEEAERVEVGEDKILV